MNGFDINNEQIRQEQLKQMEEAKKKMLLQILSKEAYERLGRARLANPEIVSQAELYLLQLFQSGKLKEKVTDSQLKEILRILSSGKKKINIKWK